LPAGAIRVSSEMYSATINTEKLPWTALDFPGVFMRIIHEHKQSGGMAVMTRLDPGASIPAHIHTKADETVFVISGDFVEDGIEYGPGSFFAAPAGAPHGPHLSRTGCVVLTTFSAPLDFQIVNGPKAA
jgi:quercetin dioxygenase-like cupin family protein